MAKNQLNLKFECNKYSWVKEITIKELPESEDEVKVLARILYRAKDTNNFRELIQAVQGYGFYTPIITALIRTNLLSEELYDLIFELFQRHKEVCDALLNTTFRNNPIPIRLYNQILELYPEWNYRKSTE